MPEWPRTVRHNQMRRIAPPDEGLLLTAASELAFKRKAAFSAILRAIRVACRRESEPKDTVTNLDALADGIAKGQAVEIARMVVALACAEAMRQSPSIKTWTYLWFSLAWHSASLEQFLPRAIVATAVADPGFKTAFLKVAGEVISEATALPGRRGIVRDRETLPQLRDAWKASPSLYEIWSGLRRAGSALFRDDDGILRIVSELDPAAFVELLTIFDNPYPVMAALEMDPAAWSFERWQKLFALAPVAFTDDGVWNRSTIVPCLLVLAHHRLSRGEFGIGPHVTDEMLATATSEFNELAAQVAIAVSTRNDRAGCTLRWATWLMRLCVTGADNETPPYPANIRSHGYIESALVNALGKSLPAAIWRPSTSRDAEPWEEWCYRCALVTIAAEGVIGMPPADPFLERWDIQPEDWAGQRGRELKERASLFETFGKRADAYGTRLLAIPLAESPDPPRIWRRLWADSVVLREIVEFRDPDNDENDGWSGAGAAARLMQLVFGLGLMILDSLFDPDRKIQGNRQSVAAEIFGLLADAAKEMGAIDRISFVYWQEAARHLAVRRAIWADAREGLVVSFDESTHPDFADFLTDLSGNTEQLLILLQMTLRNGAPKDRVQQAIGEADIDLKSQIEFAERLIALDQRRASIGIEQLEAARSLL